MRIYLFRHGPAGSRAAARWPNDDLRPLTARGAERTEIAARGLVRLEPKPTLVLSSPLTRAQETARLLHEALGLKGDVETLPALSPGGSSRSILLRLGQCKANDAVFLVGHEPDLGQLAGLLVYGPSGGSLPLKKAGACLVIFPGPVKSGTGQLRWLLTPRILRGLARKGSKV